MQNKDTAPSNVPKKLYFVDPGEAVTLDLTNIAESDHAYQGNLHVSNKDSTCLQIILTKNERK